MAPRKIKDLGRIEPIEFTVLGEPASKANSRRLVRIGGVSRLIKSAKALSYVDAFNYQCPTLGPLFEGDVHVEMEIYYASKRPDLDESAILDAMQGRIYRNDRQVKSKLVRWGLDRERPRCRVRVSALAGGAGPSNT